MSATLRASARPRREQPRVGNNGAVAAQVDGSRMVDSFGLEGGRGACSLEKTNAQGGLVGMVRGSGEACKVAR